MSDLWPLPSALLAQTSPPPAVLASWLEVLFYLAGGTAALVAAWYYLTGRDGERRIVPSPLVVTAATQFATRAELEEVKRTVATLTAKIDRGFAALDLKRTTSLEKLHGDLQTRTDALRAELKTDTDKIHHRVTDVFGALRELTGRVRGERLK